MRHTACAAAIVALLSSAGLALAGEGAPATSELGRNAALTYWRAFAASPEVTNDELDNIISPRPGTEPKGSPEKKAELVERWRRALALMHEAAAVPQCDWGIDYEKEGTGTSLEHLAKARALARAAAFRAKYLWEKGQRKDAAEDLRAAVIMARHVGNDGRETIIAMLVQISIEAIVQDATAQLLTDREAADMFADVLGDFSNGSTAPLVKNAILSDKKMFIPWFRRQVASEPDAAKRLADEIGSDPSSAWQEARAKLGQLQQGDVLKLLDELDKQYDEIAAVSVMPFQEFQAKAPALQEKFKASKNPFSVLFLPALTRVREEEERYRIRWAMVRAAIEFRREGEGALSKVTDPHDGKPLQYTALEGGAFELKSALLVRGNQQIVMTFGNPSAKKD